MVTTRTTKRKSESTNNKSNGNNKKPRQPDQTPPDQTPPDQNSPDLTPPDLDLSLSGPSPPVARPQRSPPVERPPPPPVDIKKILNEDIPNAIEDINTLLDSSECRGDGPEDSQASSPTDMKTVLTDIFGSLENVTALLSKTNEEEEGTPLMIPPNKKILQLLDALEPHLIRLATLARTVKHWITLAFPKMESGGNFGVDVQASIAELARKIEAACLSRMQLIPSYYLSRVDFLQTLAENPVFVDSAVGVKKYDDVQLIKFRMFVVDIKHDYETLHHFVSTNIDLLQKPRPMISADDHNSYFG